MKNTTLNTSYRLLSIVGLCVCVLTLSNCDDQSDDTNSPDAGSEATGDDYMLIPHPSWGCSMTEGIPSPQSGELVFEVNGQLGEIYDMGETQFGHRHVIEIASATVTGDNINAQFLAGGMDLQLTLSNGAMEVEQVISMMTDDEKLIYFRSCGTSPNEESSVRMVPVFEAPNDSNYQFLHTGTFVGTRDIDMQNKTLKMAVYDVSQVVPMEDSVEVVEPDDVSDQSWECATLSKSPGEIVYTETVSIGEFLTTGESKNGTRNIIAITGGTAEGRIQGTIPAMGADFQLINDDGFSLDARYAVTTDDGEIILVRNCGLIDALVPTFETRRDGPYAWVNENKWLSSEPEILNNGTAVKLTIYEAN